MRFAKLVFFLCAAGFTLHFSLILLHNTPERYLTPRMESYSHLYSYPMFHQGWALFAPTPQPMSKRLEMRYCRAGTWSAWSGAESRFVAGHQRYRVLSDSKMFHVAQASAYFLWLDKDLFDQQSQDPSVYYANSRGYHMACHYAYQYAHHFMTWDNPDSLQVRLILDDPFEQEPSEVLDFPTYIPESP